MALRIGLLLVVFAGLAGCSANNPTSTPAAKTPAAERLPPEVTGDPESALPKRPK